MAKRECGNAVHVWRLTFEGVRLPMCAMDRFTVVV